MLHNAKQSTLDTQPQKNIGYSETCGPIVVWPQGAIRVLAWARAHGRASIVVRVAGCTRVIRVPAEDARHWRRGTPLISRVQLLRGEENRQPAVQQQRLRRVRRRRRGETWKYTKRKGEEENEEKRRKKADKAKKRKIIYSY